ncbi:MAG: HK97 gp10 family phage protein [Clostridia bacterium]|nr:HK97 gp10 family phage protein [Clostridia bacterium]
MIEFNDRIVDEIETALNDALMEGAENIAAESKKNVPEDTGELKESCKVEASGHLEAEVIYDAVYAARIHEDMNMRHRKGQAKFLEDAFNNMAGSVGKLAEGKVAEAIRE